MYDLNKNEVIGIMKIKTSTILVLDNIPLYHQYHNASSIIIQILMSKKQNKKDAKNSPNVKIKQKLIVHVQNNTFFNSFETTTAKETSFEFV